LAFSIGYYISTFYKGKFEVFLSLIISFLSYLIIAFILIFLTISIFLIVTSLPKYVPSNIAGIFSAFPSVLLPLLLIIHFRHSNLQARTIIKNTPFGLSSVVIYSLVVYFTYERWGIALGTIAALACSLLYVLIQGKVLKALNLIK